jgi:probable HAF family extracellular repeat protein
MRRAALMLFVSFLFALAGGRVRAVTPVPGGYTLTDLGTLGGEGSFAYGVNDSGHVVGNAEVPSLYEHAFLYTGTLPIVDLGAIGPYSGAAEINDSGHIAGSTVTSGYRTMVWTGGAGYIPAPLTGFVNYAYAINDSDVIVGHWAAAPLYRPQAMMYDLVTSTFTDIGTLLAAFGATHSVARDVNESGMAVGYMLESFVTPTRAFRFTPPAQVQLLDSLSGRGDIANAINDEGEIAGECHTVSGEEHACLWSGASVTDLLTLGGNYSSAHGINNKGQVVGAAMTADALHAFLYRGGEMIDLNGFIPTDSGFELLSAEDINESGQIVGWGVVNGLAHGYLLTPNTLPGSAVVVAPVDAATGTAPVTLTFDNVTGGGGTTVTISSTGPPPSAGFSLGDPSRFYEISTSASFTGSVQVCIDYTGIDFGGATPTLQHYEGGTWVTVPATIDAATSTICGSVTSLSPFAMFGASETTNEAPTVAAGGPYSVPEGGLTTLTASGSDPEGELLSYAWDLDGDGTFESPDASVTFSAALLDGPSTHDVAVQVTDAGSLTAAASTSVTVSNVAPSVGPVTVFPVPVLIGAPMAARAPFTDPGAADTHSASWSWGDGSSTAGTVASGSVAGMHSYAAAGTYTVGAVVIDDDGGAGSAATPATVIYKICPLYEQGRAVRSGSTLPVKVQLCDAAGANLSSPSIVLTARGVSLVSTSAPGTLADSGQSNPDLDFRYDAALGGYILNLSTSGLSTGTHVLRFTAGAHPYEYAVTFQVR